MKKQPELVYEKHLLRFPMTHVIFGKSFQMLCEVLFEYTETDDGNFRIKVNSLTGVVSDGTAYDIMYLTEDEDSMYASFILVCIHKNKAQWNLKPDGGEREWWEQHGNVSALP